MPRSRMLLLLGLCSVLAIRAAGCSPDDELATLDLVICELQGVEPQCSDGVCTVDDEAVETERILARAVESIEGSRFGDDGLFVLATWEDGDRWIELEFDVPTNRVGYVDMDLRYTEYVDGEETYDASDLRGRIVLVEPASGALPYAAHLELRAESEDGETRRLHQGHLDPDNNEDLVDPGPPEAEVDWAVEGVELLIMSSAVETTYEPARAETYVYDWRAEDALLDAVVTSCGSSGGGCQTDEEEAAYSDYEGESDYIAEGEGCGGESGGCSGDTSSTDDTYSYADDGTTGCGGSDSSGSTCQGDSDDDVWDDDSSGWCNYSDGGSDEASCSGDDSSYDTGSLGCEGGDSSKTDSSGCDGGGDTTGGSKSSSCSGTGKTYLASGFQRHRVALRDRARGRLPRPFRQALGFFPIGIAFVFTQLLLKRGDARRR